MQNFYLMEVLKYEAFQKFKSPPLRIKYEDKWLVSGGFNGEPKDIVVDNAKNPKIFLGLINDKGLFDRKTQTWDDWINMRT